MFKCNVDCYGSVDSKVIISSEGVPMVIMANDAVYLVAEDKNDVLTVQELAGNGKFFVDRKTFDKHFVSAI